MEENYTDFLESAENVVESVYARHLLEYIRSQNPSPYDLLSYVGNLVRTFFQTEWIKTAAAFIGLFLILGILETIFQKKEISSAVRYILTVTFSILLAGSTNEILAAMQVYMRDFSTFFGTIIPTLGVLAASGGNVTSATANSISLSVFLTATQFLLHTALPYINSLFCGLAVFDAVYGGGKISSLSATVKNFLFGTLGFSTALFGIVISFQNLTAVNTDSISGKTLRLMIAKAIPVVGTTIGETIRIVGGSLYSIKNAVGITAIVFLFGIYLPILIALLGNGFLMNIFVFLCDFFSIPEIKWIFFHLKHTFDFALAAFTCVFMIAILNLGIFMKTMPAMLE